MNAKPKLQLALDVLDIDAATRATKQAYPAIDVIEAGTLLCLSEGMDAVRALRNEFDMAAIVADVRVVRAGRNIAEMAFEAGANTVTVVGEAPMDTLEAAIQVARSRGGEIQVELHEGWTRDQAAGWRDLGVQQVIFHRGVEVDAVGGEWSGKALNTIRELARIGFRVTATGGISPGKIAAFRDVPVSVFIAGRAIVQAPDPLVAAQEFQSAIEAAYA